MILQGPDGRYRIEVWVTSTWDTRSGRPSIVSLSCREKRDGEPEKFSEAASSHPFFLYWSPQYHPTR